MSEEVYSRDGETFMELEDVLDSLQDDFVNGEKVIIEKGTSVKAKHDEFVTPYNWLEEFQNRAYDNYGEWAEDYLSDVSLEKAKELQVLVTEWLNKNAKEPSFYKVFNTEKIEVTVE